MTRTLIALSLAALLAGCSTFQLGTVLYCAKDTACRTDVSPFRPADPVPAASPGQAGAAALPLVNPAKAASAPA